MRAGGHNQKPLIATPANESEPSWSPDGEWLVYTSDETGGKQLHLHHIPTGLSHHLTFTSDKMRQAVVGLVAGRQTNRVRRAGAEW